jgi:hypothetical protein
VRRGAGPIDDAGVWLRTQYGRLPEPLQKTLPAIGAASAAALAAYLGSKGYSHYRSRHAEPLDMGWVDVAPSPAFIQAARAHPRFRIVRKGAFLPQSPGLKKLM